MPWFHPLSTCVVQVKERRRSVSAVYTFRDYSRTQETEADHISLQENFITVNSVTFAEITLKVRFINDKCISKLQLHC